MTILNSECTIIYRTLFHQKNMVDLSYNNKNIQHDIKTLIIIIINFIRLTN